MDKFEKILLTVFILIAIILGIGHKCYIDSCDKINKTLTVLDIQIEETQTLSTLWITHRIQPIYITDEKYIVTLEDENGVKYTKEQDNLNLSVGDKVDATILVRNKEIVDFIYQ